MEQHPDGILLKKEHCVLLLASRLLWLAYLCVLAAPRLAQMEGVFVTRPELRPPPNARFALPNYASARSRFGASGNLPVKASF